VIRVLGLILSFALLVFGVIGLVTGAPRWLVALDFAAGGVGLALDAMIWWTEGRYSVYVALGMSAALIALFFAGVVSGMGAWLSWSIFAVSMAFLAVGVARTWGRDFYGGNEL
jgi:hypothetical protein